MRVMAAPRMNVDPRCSFGGRMLVAPLHQRHQHRVEIGPFLRRDVLERLRVVPVASPLQESVIDKRLKAIAEDVRCHAEFLADPGESSSSQEHLAHDQDAPTLPDDCQGSRDRTVLVREWAEWHGRSLAQSNLQIKSSCPRVLLANCKSSRKGSSLAHRWKVLAIVSVAVFVVGLDLFIVNVALPDIAESFNGTDIASASWVLNAYAIVVAALMVSAGRLADRVGRRTLFLSGLATFALGSALAGLSTSLEMLVAARAVQAVGAAALLPTSLALLLPEFPLRERAAAIGIWASAGGIAAAFGPPLGGLMVEASWRLIFLINLPVAAVGGWAASRVLQESRDEGGERPDPAGSLLLTLAIGLLALGLVQAPTRGWFDPRTEAAFIIAVIGLAGFWARCLTHYSPLIDIEMLRVRSFAMANVAALMFSAAFAAMLLGVVLYLTNVWQDSTLVVGLSLAPGRYSRLRWPRWPVSWSHARANARSAPSGWHFSAAVARGGFGSLTQRRPTPARCCPVCSSPVLASG